MYILWHFPFMSFWFNFVNFPNCEKGKCLQFSCQPMGYILIQLFFMWNNDLVFHIVLAICNSLVCFYWVQIKQTLTMILWFTPFLIRFIIKFLHLTSLLQLNKHINSVKNNCKNEKNEWMLAVIIVHKVKNKYKCYEWRNNYSKNKWNEKCMCIIPKLFVTMKLLALCSLNKNKRIKNFILTWLSSTKLHCKYSLHASATIGTDFFCQWWGSCFICCLNYCTSTFWPAYRGFSDCRRLGHFCKGVRVGVVYIKSLFPIRRETPTVCFSASVAIFTIPA